MAYTTLLVLNTVILLLFYFMSLFILHKKNATFKAFFLGFLLAIILLIYQSFQNYFNHTVLFQTEETYEPDKIAKWASYRAVMSKFFLVTDMLLPFVLIIVLYCYLRFLYSKRKITNILECLMFGLGVASYSLLPILWGLLKKYYLLFLSFGNMDVSKTDRYLQMSFTNPAIWEDTVNSLPALVSFCFAISITLSIFYFAVLKQNKWFLFILIMISYWRILIDFIDFSALGVFNLMSLIYLLLELLLAFGMLIVIFINHKKNKF